MGRQRVEIKRIDDKARRQTTFTKRRDGLFKKARELCTLCGAEATIIAFSGAGNTFAFGDPSVDSVIDRYLTETSSSSSDADSEADADMDVHGGERVKELEDKLAEAVARLEVEKKRGEVMDVKLAMVGGQPLLDGPVEALWLEALEQLKEMKEKAAAT